ncbi:MAG: SMP-30/gluconolactonase/LRE family protein [Bacteroidota bacterium]
MRTYLLFFAAICFLSITVRAQFGNGQAADIVLGQANFNLATPPASPSTTTMVPYSIAVDAANNKVFVADASFNRVLRWSTTSINSNDPAEAVFGQATFITFDANVTQTGMDFPTGVCIAPGTSILLVADVNANRVLRFNNAYNITSGSASADVVLGEPDFTTGGGGTTQYTVSVPYGVAMDASGHLYVADQGNNRVLRFDNATSKTNGGQADGVLGQADFTHLGSGTTATTMDGPTGVAIDYAGTLYVADQANNRVLYFFNAASKANGAAADGVIGQADLTHHSIGHTASTLSTPFGVAVDGTGRLYISDQGNNRILFYASQTAITTNVADSVLGQSNLNSNPSGTSATTLSGPASLVIDNPNGKLWVADLGNNRVLRYSASSSTLVPLPVELTSFTATGLNNEIELAWATATEINNYGFDIERSTINNEQSTINNWAKVGFVTGHGTTNAPQSYSFTDASARVGKFSYRLKQIDHSGNFVYSQTIEATVGVTPGTVWLDNNYPNPFNPSTKISFVLGTKGHATLKVYNLLGQEVATIADGEFNDGEVQTFTFDSSKLSSGIYYYQLESGNKTEIKKMMLLK